MSVAHPTMHGEQAMDSVLDETLVYTLRPERTALWLPRWLLNVLGVQHGQQLTAAQMGHEEVQRLLEFRREKKARREE